MDDQAAEQVRSALRAATRDVVASPELDARVDAILRGRQQRRRWRLPALAAAVALAVGATAVIVGEQGSDGRRVVTTAPDRRPEAGWTQSAPSPLGARLGVSLVWTGREAIVWGGVPEPPQAGDGGELARADGAALDVGSGTWRLLPPAPLAARYAHVAVWTGREMIVWGGVVNPSGRVTGGASPNDGAAYDPASGTWRRIAPSPLPPPSPTSLGAGQAAVWTGREMLVWGRVADTGSDPAGAAYDPSTDSWRELPPLPGIGNVAPTLVWTGTEVIRFPRPSSANRDGDADSPPTGAAVTHEGDALDPEGGSWRALPSSGLSALALAVAAWTGEELLVVGAPPPPGTDLPTGTRPSARYRPADGAWHPMAPLPVSGPFTAQVIGWTGTELLVVGTRVTVGQPGAAPVAAAYDPARDEWRDMPVPPSLDVDEAVGVPAGSGVAVWSGGRILRYGS